nr:LytTR family DNA-binding domain-containing protein [Mucilaginibacter sp. L294]
MKRKIRCLIVDDDKRYIRELKKLIDICGDELELVSYTTDPHEAEKIITSGDIEVDIAFIDIQMPEMDGFELGPKISDYTEVVYVTAYMDYGAESYTKEAFYFLVKPVDISAFNDCIAKVRQKLSRQPNNTIESKPYFFVPRNSKVDIKVFKDQVIYIEALEKYVKIVLIQGKPIITYLQISEVEEEASHPSYLRISRSCIVNIDHIKSKCNANYMLTMEDDRNIYVGKTYKKIFREEFEGVSIRTKRNLKDKSDPINMN